MYALRDLGEFFEEKGVGLWIFILADNFIEPKTFETASNRVAVIVRFLPSLLYPEIPSPPVSESGFQLIPQSLPDLPDVFFVSFSVIVK